MGQRIQHYDFDGYATHAQKLDREGSDGQLFRTLYAAVKDVQIDEKSISEFLVDLGKLAFKKNTSQSDVYPLIRELLNAISSTMLKMLKDLKARDDDQFKKSIFNEWSCNESAVWVRCDHQAPLGDFLSSNVKPDHAARFEPYQEPLPGTDASHPSPNTTNLAWQEIISVGEVSKHTEHTYGQIKTYLDQHSRYRPDVETVHGFYLGMKDKIQLNVKLFSANASGVYSSISFADALEAWCTHVFLVYHAHVTRCLQLTHSLVQFVPARTSDKLVVFHHLTSDTPVASKTTTITFSPFFAKPPGGSMSLVGLAIARGTLSDQQLQDRWAEKDGIGIVKLAYCHEPRSHKDLETGTEFESRETMCYHLAHGNIPGSGWTGSPDTIASNLPTLRARTTLSSLIKTRQRSRSLEELYEKGVKHRDISFRNILIRPTHTGEASRADDLNAVEPMPPTKSSIEQGIGNDLPEDVRKRLDQGARRRCLLTDLNDAATEAQQDEQQKTCGHCHVYGTGDQRKSGLHWQHEARHLLANVFGHEDEINYPAVTRVAFDPTLRGIEPNSPRNRLYDAAGFKATIRRVSSRISELLDESPNKRLKMSEIQRHVPRCDAEIFSFYLARSKPKDDHTLADDNHRDYVLGRLRENGSFGRRRHLTEELVHPDLKPLELFFCRMRYYLLDVPWCHLEQEGFDIHPSHAFVALRRIILRCLLSKDSDVQRALSIQLDMAPRGYKPAPSDTEHHSSSSTNTYACAFRTEAPPQPQRTSTVSSDPIDRRWVRHKTSNPLFNVPSTTISADVTDGVAGKTVYKTPVTTPSNGLAVLEVLWQMPLPKTCRNRMDEAIATERWLRDSAVKEKPKRSGEVDHPATTPSAMDGEELERDQVAVALVGDDDDMQGDSGTI
ncbi:hypothetical protein BKA62DRAFT_671468 [Auriculariales sp. MPI-PUGE-AT-0066]|nr:hypothetical protein BKA62DRAFT_671468 [Auriculariales sp. MPI-PUGE-AT-0066]